MIVSPGRGRDFLIMRSAWSPVMNASLIASKAMRQLVECSASGAGAAGAASGERI